MPSIILSTVALECFVNETVERLSYKNYRQPGVNLSVAASWLEFVESKKGNTLEKLEAFHLAFKGEKADRGGLPYQDLALLYQLRNELVHRKPEPFGDWDPNDKIKEYEPHRFVRLLSQRGIVTKPPGNSPPIWSQFVLQDKTAKWAFNTAVSGVRYLQSMLPESSFAEINAFMADHIEPIG
jgi:hypothetical protein